MEASGSILFQNVKIEPANKGRIKSSTNKKRKETTSRLPPERSHPWTVQISSGRCKQFLTHAGRFADAIVGGWQIEGTYTFQSGFPLRFANDAFYLGTKISIPKGQESLSRWFNTDAFVSVLGATAPSCGAFPAGSTNCASPADHLRTLPFYYADVRMQTINNVDLGLRKDIHINERMKVQLRMEFVNAFNHPLLSTLSGGGAVVSPSSSAFGTVSASNQQNYDAPRAVDGEVYLLRRSRFFESPGSLLSADSPVLFGWLIKLVREHPCPF